MAYTPFDRLMDTVRPHLPGSMDTAIKQELFTTMLEFFKRSTAWREDISFTLRAGRNTADLLPTAGRINNLMYVVNEAGTPVQRAFMPDECTIKFPNPPGNDEDYTATVSITVADPTTRDAFPIVPYQLVERYLEELESGILFRMMSQPKKPYTDLVLAAMHQRKFIGGASRARNEVNAGHAEGSQNWLFPQTFRTVR